MFIASYYVHILTSIKQTSVLLVFPIWIGQKNKQINKQQQQQQKKNKNQEKPGIKLSVTHMYNSEQVL